MHHHDSRLGDEVPHAAVGLHIEAERLWRRILERLPPLGNSRDEVRIEATLRMTQVIWLQDRLDEAEQLYDSTIEALRGQIPTPERLLLDALLQKADFLTSYNFV